MSATKNLSVKNVRNSCLVDTGYLYNYSFILLLIIIYYIIYYLYIYVIILFPGEFLYNIEYSLFQE